MAIDFRGCNVVIKDRQTNEVLCETQVVEYDKNLNQIYLFGVSRESLQKHVLVVLSHPTGVYEFQGNVRKRNQDGLLEVSLFQKRNIKKRQNKRFDLYAELPVDHLPGKQPEDEEIVNVQNISVSGILVHAEKDLLKIGDVFYVHLPVKGEVLAVKTKVVRLQGETPDGFEYGCTFESLEK